MTMRPLWRRALTAALPTLIILSTGLRAADQLQWGDSGSRNMVSSEVGLPESVDPETGRNVAWSAEIGTFCYSTPIAASGKVFIGTNNSTPRDPRHQGDRGVMMCFDAVDGSLSWQLIVPKLTEDRFHDWPKAGMCSPATVEGDRVYTVTNRDEVVCLDLHGMANGNDGPFFDEGRFITPLAEPAMKPGPLDADILWTLDLRKVAGVRPHDSVHCSVLLDGPNLYINTTNGLNSEHTAVDKPDAPSLVVVDKATGRLLAQEDEGISKNIFHCTWASPTLGQVHGRRLIFFGGGDGVCYAFDALSLDPAASRDTLRLAWRFDCDPTAPKENIHSYIRNREVSPSNIKSMPVFHEDRLYVTVGGDIWWGKEQSWLQCIDATGTGDITKDGLVWAYPMATHCCSTPAIHEGLIYVADCDGNVHCVDATTGQPYWVHDTGREFWGSTLVADGKVYVGNRRGEFFIFAAGKEKRLLDSVRLGREIASSATAANGTLYIASMSRLYAFRVESEQRTTQQ